MEMKDSIIENLQDLYDPINKWASLSNYLKGNKKYISFLGAAFSGGQPKRGTEKAPMLFRTRNILHKIKSETGLEVRDLGDVSEDISNEMENVEKFPRLKNMKNVSNYCNALHNKIHEESEKGGFALTIGGDHSIAMGTISGLLKSFPNLCVVWVDAHADINTPGSSISGNFHGMPLSFLTGIAEKLDSYDWIKENRLSTDRIVYIGLRDLDASEKRILVERKIKAFWADDVERLGIRQVMIETFNHFDKDAPIHLSFDIDGLDQLEAPSTGTPVRGGLTLREGKFISESLYESGRLIGMDLVEVNPDLGDPNQLEVTMNAAFQIVLSALGRNNQKERSVIIN